MTLRELVLLQNFLGESQEYIENAPREYKDFKKIKSAHLPCD